MNPLISVIIPVYKVEAYLAACVESVLAQTWQNFEIILVDDGSPDNCPKMCDEFAARDSRIRVIHKENGGVSTARNVGVHAAKGTYLAFLDSDDLWSPFFLERMYHALADTTADIAVCDFRRFWGADTVFPTGSGRLVLMDQQETFDCLFNHRNEALVVPWGKLYRKEAFSGITYPEGRVHEDEAVIHELIGNVQKVVWLEEVHYLYRFAPNSITTSRFSLKRFDAVWAKEQRIAWFENRGMQELADKTRITTLSLLMYLHREAVNARAERKLCSQIHRRFCQLREPKLIRHCSGKMRVRFWLFHYMPRIISVIDHYRLK